MTTVTDRLTAERVPFTLVVFSDGHSEAFPNATADVFEVGVLHIEFADESYRLVGSALWRTATTYDAQGFPLATHCSTQAPNTDPLMLPVHRAFVAAKAKGCKLTWTEFLLDHARVTLKAFYGAPITMSTLQPVLDLAVALNPEVRG